MAKQQLSARIAIDFKSNSPEWRRIRTAPALREAFEGYGTEWVADLNDELHAAQTARDQLVEDGYDAHIEDAGDRVRLYIVAASARAQAHEAKHHSILRLMKTGTSFEVHVRKPNKPENPRTHTFGVRDD